jgi:hypothetical protein
MGEMAASGVKTRAARACAPRHVPARPLNRKVAQADNTGPTPWLTWEGCLRIKRARFVACPRFNEYLKTAS